MKRAFVLLAAALTIAGCNRDGEGGGGSGTYSETGAKASRTDTTGLPGGASTGQAGGGLGAESRTNQNRTR
jgi:hypothetical protein